MADTIDFFSYNTRGTSENVFSVIKSITDSNSIFFLCLQEHFLLKKNLRKLNINIENATVFGKAAVKNLRNPNVVDRARPRGGLAFVISPCLRSSLNIRGSESWRIQAATLSLGSTEYLIINTYFPVDTQKSESSHEELLETLAEIKRLMDVTKYDILVLLGDLNMSIPRRSDHVRFISNFWMENNLMTVCDKIDYTCGDVTLDHVVIHKQHEYLVKEVKAIHTLDNNSDHDPIQVKMKCPIVITEEDIDEVSLDDNSRLKKRVKFNWKTDVKERIKKYKDEVEKKIRGKLLEEKVVINDAAKCNDTNCKNEKCLEEINDNLKDICDAMMEGCKESMERVGAKEGDEVNDKESDDKVKDSVKSKRRKKEKKVVKGWNTLVKPVKEEATFWHNLWHDCGRPREGEVYNVMKKTRNQYHATVRRVKKIGTYIDNCRILDGTSKNDDLFASIRKSRKEKSGAASSINGKNGIKAAEIFAEKYEELFNSVKDEKDVEKVHGQMNDLINDEYESALNMISEDVIREAINRLKPEKTDPFSNLTTDFLKNAPDLLISALVSFYRSCAVHEYIPEELLIAKVIPLIKDVNVNASSPDNYRSICLSSIFLKIWDWVIILLYGDRLHAPELQFGFQRLSGTEMCSWTLIESISYYLNRGSKVYVTFMDCSKAFDKVKHSTLFQKILDAKVHPIFARLLMYSYQNQYARVAWDGVMSKPFRITNGVRQGAVLSPILFNLYTAELFEILDKAKVGNRVKGVYMGLFGYADDLALASSSLASLQTMLDITSEYARSHDITFSTNEIIAKSKTKAMVFSNEKKKGIPANLMLNGKPLPWVNVYKYLGTMVTNELEMLEYDIGVKRAKYVENANALLQEFRWAHPAIMTKINEIYNSSIYGSNLYPLNSLNLDKLYKSFNTSIRAIWDLPRNTHRYIACNLTHRHISTAIISNKINFYRKLENSSKSAVRLLFNTVRDDKRTVTGANLSFITNIVTDLGLVKYEENVTMTDTRQFSRLHEYVMIPESEQHRLPVLHDLLSIRTQYAYFEDDQFTIDDLNNMIEHICSS